MIGDHIGLNGRLGNCGEAEGTIIVEQMSVGVLVQCQLTTVSRSKSIQHVLNSRRAGFVCFKEDHISCFCLVQAQLQLADEIRALFGSSFAFSFNKFNSQGQSSTPFL